MTGWIWALGAWWAGRRKPRARPEHVSRQVYRVQTRGLGLRFTEFLRDRLRPRWLRLRRTAESEEMVGRDPPADSEAGASG